MNALDALLNLDPPLDADSSRHGQRSPRKLLAVVAQRLVARIKRA
jgi:hypothetical protein